MEIFHRAGGANLTLGTYSTWPLFAETIREEGVLNPTNWPLVQGLDTAWQSLAPFANNGVSIPAQLSAANRAIGYYTSENRVDAGEWISWNVIVYERANYQIALPFQGGGIVQVTINDSTILHQGPVTGSIVTNVTFYPGLHTLKLKGISGMATFGTGIAVTMLNAPASTTLTAVDGDSSATLTWTPVAGATSYIVRYGPEAGFPNTLLDVAANLQTCITGLRNGAAYYFTVVARNNAALGLPSNQVGVTPFGDNQTADLAAWEFAGQSGDAVNAAATIASSRVTTSLLTRGAGFGVAGWAPNDCFLGAAVNWAQTLNNAVASQHYVEFTLTPRDGRSVSVASLNYRPGFQNFTGADSDPRGTGLAWRVGQVGPFSTPVAVTGLRTATLNFCPLFTADLAAVAALQNVFEPVAFRIYFHGMGPYEAGSIGGPGNDITLVGSLISHPVTLTGTLSPSAAAINLQFTRRRNGPSHTLQRTTDFQSWTQLTSTPTVEILDATTERVTYSEPLSGTAAFFRIQIVPE